MGKLVTIEKFRHHGRVATVAEHSDFHRGDVAIVYERFELSAQLSAGRVVNRFDALGVLDGERGDGSDAVAAVRGERFQIGGGARAAGRIKTRDRQQNRRRWVAVPVRGHRLFLLQRRK